MQSFKLKFLGVTILQGVEFPIFLLISEWALQQCSATALPVIPRRRFAGGQKYPHFISHPSHHSTGMLQLVMAMAIHTTMLQIIVYMIIKKQLPLLSNTLFCSLLLIVANGWSAHRRLRFHLLKSRYNKRLNLPSVRYQAGLHVQVIAYNSL